MEVATGLGLDVGVFAVKSVLWDEESGKIIKKLYIPTAGDPAAAARESLERMLDEMEPGEVKIGVTGNNANLIADNMNIKPILEVKALQAGLHARKIKARSVLALGHENMYYLELGPEDNVTFFNRNGQCAAGSGSFWYQQATRMGYNDRELAEVALQSGTAVKISGRCAVFAKSDMTHAINEGASQAAVAAGMAKALVDLVVAGVAQNRITGPGTLVVVGGVANNPAIIKCLEEYCQERDVQIEVPPDHEYVNAIGAAVGGTVLPLSAINPGLRGLEIYTPENPLPALDPGKVFYGSDAEAEESFDLSTVYLGVDCGSVSTKCALIDGSGRFVGGIYLPTAGRPALQVLELMKELDRQYGGLLKEDTVLVSCTTGSGRFLAQKILDADYAVDEITCQAEGVKSLYDDHTLSIIEIGGEDSKFVQIKDGLLSDYNMNPVCAAGTGTFLENLAELLGVSIKEEFSRKAFQADFAIDLGDTCTLLSQTTLVSAAARGLPLEAQLASLAYSSACNYLSKTVENRMIEGRLIFTGATAKNHALAAAFAEKCEKEVFVPPRPELTGALGAALVARSFYIEEGMPARPPHTLKHLNDYTLEKRPCRASCPHEHNCRLDIIKFKDGSKFIYGDRCGRYSELERKKGSVDFPDYLKIREKIFYESAGQPLSEGVEVGIACSGLFHELYPFWAAFFRTLGARVVLSGRSGEELLEHGKNSLAADMCYPVEVLVGHYHQLVKDDPDFIFIPEIVDLEPLPWAGTWPRQLACPLLMMVRGYTVHSLKIADEKVLHAQLNFRAGSAHIAAQLRPLAAKLLGNRYSPSLFRRALKDAYKAQGNFQRRIELEACQVIEGLREKPELVVALTLGRSYTLYDTFVSKDLMSHAAKRGLIALPQDFLLEYLRGWYEGRIRSSFLEPLRADFRRYLKEKIGDMDNIYAAQAQSMISGALAAQFLNEHAAKTGLPQFHLVLQDPFRCGPNSMLRHFLDNIGGYLRLTLDEHTAPAGMITRLEAFKNTCRSRKKSVSVPFYSPRTTPANDRSWKKILIPNPSRHSGVFAALFKNYGLETADLLRSEDRDLTLARRYTNGDECLPFIQNMQDYLEYAQNNPGEIEEDDLVLFQGWACGPCRYGLYASAQSMLMDRAGYGPRKVCAVKTNELIGRFGPAFVVAVYDGMLAIDLLYKMAHVTRPYELEAGTTDALFNEYVEKVYAILRTHRFNLFQLLGGSHLAPLEKVIAEAASRFAAIPRNNGDPRPRILISGEFYVRIDDRNNQDIIRRVEAAGGEVYFAPATEFFIYTTYTNYRKAKLDHSLVGGPFRYFNKLGYKGIHWLALRDEHLLDQAAASLLHGLEEPSPREIRMKSTKYIPEHTAGEPPMTMGRTAALAGRERVAGAIFVGPFTCMPASTCEAQQGFLSEEIGIPIISVYYDGRDNANRDEFINSLVFQAQQNMMSRGV